MPVQPRLWGPGMRWPLICCFLCMVLVDGATGQWRQSNATVVEILPAGQVDWTVGLVRSTARAATWRQAAGSTTTLEAALETARQQLRETLVHLQLDAEHTVGNMLQGADEKQQRLATLVANAEVVETRYLPRGVVESTLQMPLFGPLTALLWPERPDHREPVLSTEAVVHTGIIIDARGLAMQQALFPQIFDEEGRPLYTPARVQAEMARQRGYMVYAAALDSPQIESRVGKNPLVLRARRVSDRRRINVIIHQADALQLQGSALLQALLVQCRVVIVS